MRKYAVVKEDGSFEVRQIDPKDAEKVSHKKLADGNPILRPLFDEGEPPVNAIIETMSREVKISPDKVEVSYVITSRDLEVVKENLIERLASESASAIRKIGRNGVLISEHLAVVDEARRFRSGETEGLQLLQASVDAGAAASLSEAADLAFKDDSIWRARCANVRKIRMEASVKIANAKTAEKAFLIFSKVDLKGQDDAGRK